MAKNTSISLGDHLESFITRQIEGGRCGGNKVQGLVPARGLGLLAYDARDGRKLWSMPAQASIVAGPITYELDGEQYIAVPAGGPWRTGRSAALAHRPHRAGT